MSTSEVSRRIVFQGALGCGTLLLAGCGSDASEPTVPSGSETPSAGPAPVNLGPADEVPVGGGVIFPEHQVVVTQPTKGKYQGFSSRCTHQGFEVNRVADGQIICPLHGSRFAVADGAPTKGPATMPLAAVSITVKDGDLVLNQ